MTPEELTALPVGAVVTRGAYRVVAQAVRPTGRRWRIGGGHVLLADAELGPGPWRLVWTPTEQHPC